MKEKDYFQMVGVIVAVLIAFVLGAMTTCSTIYDPNATTQIQILKPAKVDK